MLTRLQWTLDDPIQANWIHNEERLMKPGCRRESAPRRELLDPVDRRPSREAVERSTDQISVAPACIPSRQHYS